MNRKKLLRDVATLAALVLVILAARSSLADHYYVPSGSMLPTIELGDRILVNKLAYGFRVPVPADKYYLLGDNRGNSYDSRFFGLVDRSAILGRAVGVFLGREGFSFKPL